MWKLDSQIIVRLVMRPHNYSVQEYLLLAIEGGVIIHIPPPSFGTYKSYDQRVPVILKIRKTL